jgi:dihydroorotate dehydrogenase electron transfer subunit
MNEGEVISIKRFSEDLFILELFLKEETSFKPGQFAMVESPGRPLMRPFSIFQLEEKKLSFLIRVKGPGTNSLLNLRPGKRLRLILPLGKPYPEPEPEGEVWLLAGGIGIASLFPLGLLLVKKGFKVKLFWGAKSASHLPFPLLWRFKEGGLETFLSTEDGSMGQKGLLEDLIPSNITAKTIYTCGPVEMIKRIFPKLLSAPKAYFSLEERMACGLGACRSCVLWMEEIKTVCKEGPVFEKEDLLKWQALKRP